MGSSIVESSGKLGEVNCRCNYIERQARTPPGASPGGVQFDQRSWRAIGVLFARHDYPHDEIHENPWHAAWDERQQESQGGLSSLVLVDAVFLQAVAAAPGLGVVQFQSQVIASKEPLKGDPRLLQPGGVIGRLIGGQAG